jgi:hypothetical protein
MIGMIFLSHWNEFFWGRDEFLTYDLKKWEIVPIINKRGLKNEKNRPTPKFKVFLFRLKRYHFVIIAIPT